MILEILQLLSVDDFKGESENIDFAKGKYKLPLTFREAWKKHKRYGKGDIT